KRPCAATPSSLGLGTSRQSRSKASSSPRQGKFTTGSNGATASSASGTTTAAPACSRADERIREGRRSAKVCHSEKLASNSSREGCFARGDVVRRRKRG